MAHQWTAVKNAAGKTFNVICVTVGIITIGVFMGIGAAIGSAVLKIPLWLGCCGLLLISFAMWFYDFYKKEIHYLTKKDLDNLYNEP